MVARPRGVKDTTSRYYVVRKSVEDGSWWLVKDRRHVNDFVVVCTAFGIRHEDVSVASFRYERDARNWARHKNKDTEA